jgi:hypothetical protein
MTVQARYILQFRFAPVSQRPPRDDELIGKFVKSHQQQQQQQKEEEEVHELLGEVEFTGTKRG